MEAIRLKTKEIPSIINHKNLKNSRISREDFFGGRNYHKNKSGILRERERERILQYNVLIKIRLGNCSYNLESLQNTRNFLPWLRLLQQSPRKVHSGMSQIFLVVSWHPLLASQTGLQLQENKHENMESNTVSTYIILTYQIIVNKPLLV